MKPGVDYIGISVAFICHDGSGNILLAKRSVKCRDEQGAWEFGGGKLEFGEHPKDGALREVREEYRTDGIVEQTLPPFSLLRNFDGVSHHWMVHPFLIRVNPKTVAIGEPDYMDEIGWFSLDTLPQPLHQGVQVFIREHGALIRAYCPSAT